MATTGDGRGAWTDRGKPNGESYYQRRDGFDRDGTIPTEADGFNGVQIEWFRSVNYGVKAIQLELVNLGFLEAGNFDLGLYGKRTAKAVKEFQATTDIDPIGVVGRLTMAALLRPHFAEFGEAYDINPKWIWGISKQESGHDPGAQGWDTPHDFGIFQFNTLVNLTPSEAFDMIFSLQTFCRRWKAASRKYDGKGTELRISCCIMQHRSPLAADYLFEKEVDYSPDAAKYVFDVRSLAETW